MLYITKRKGFISYRWSEKMDDFENYFYNGKEILQRLPELKQMETFVDKGSNEELLIYKKEKYFYSCCYEKIGINYNKTDDKCERWVKVITHIYGNKGLLYEINPYKKYKEFE